MRKRLIAVLLVIVAVLGMAATVCAYESQSDHDGDLKMVLFGKENAEIPLMGDKKRAFTAIANAASISIDQFSTNETQRQKEKDFNELQSELYALNLPRLDVSFDDIELNNKTIKSDIKVTPNTHRKFTHQGWNCKTHPDMDFWELRKDVLRDTVNRVLFDPQPILAWMPWLNDILSVPGEQCDAFCGMVYYVHILGDHIDGNTPSKMTDITPLIQYTSFSSPGIIVELQELLRVLFPSQRSDRTFLELEQELESLKIKAEKNCGTWGSIDTEYKCAKNQEYAKELLKILGDYIHKLLKDEKFFNERFS